MKPSDQLEVIEIVRKLNDDIEESSESGFIPILAFETDGYNVCVVYLGDRIWNSEDDERDIVDDKPEDLRTFLVEAINSNSASIGQIKLK